MPYQEKVAWLSLVDTASGWKIIDVALLTSVAAEVVHDGVAALSCRRQS